MHSGDTAKKSWWKRVSDFTKGYASLVVIIAAALLLELTTAVMYYAQQNTIQQTMERLMEREMNAIYLTIRNKLATVEVTLDNMAWETADDLVSPDSLMKATRQLVEHNQDILGSSIPCVPDYYPQKGRWYEPYSVRRADGSIESMQVGSASHDYTKTEFFTVPIAKGSGHWCEPYMDSDGAKVMVTTYSVPVRNAEGVIAAVVAADISLAWLEAIINENKIYKSMRRFLVTGSGNLLAGQDTATFRAALEQLNADSDKAGYVTIEDQQREKQHVFFHPVGGKTDWVLISVVDDSDVFGQMRKLRVKLMLPAMIGLFFIGFIVYRSSHHLERLRQVNAEKERIGSELHVAGQIQQSMLPHDKVSGEGLEVRGFLKPAREVGGDLYDYFIRDEKLFFCIGDVSGKGVPSAMLMAVIHSLFRAFSAHENNPARIMQTINDAACRGNDSNMFVTLFIGVLDLPTGHLRYCDAGHDAPFIIHHSRCVMLQCHPNMPVGVFDDVKYGVQEMQLMPDSTLFLYTDGLTEAKRARKQWFGLQRVEEVLATCIGKHPQELLETVTDAVHQFVKDAEQSDDLTLLAIRYTPKQFESTWTETLTLKNDVHEVKRLSSFMKSVTGKMGIESSLARQLRLAVEEAVVNVIDYAYPAGTEGEVTVKMMSDEHVLLFQITDSGVPFDPTAMEKTDTTLSAEDRQIGGLGILLVRELMDSINYERREGKNILTLTKKMLPSSTSRNIGIT